MSNKKEMIRTTKEQHKPHQNLINSAPQKNSKTKKSKASESTRNKKQNRLKLDSLNKNKSKMKEGKVKAKEDLKYSEEKVNCEEAKTKENEKLEIERMNENIGSISDKSFNGCMQLLDRQRSLNSKTESMASFLQIESEAQNEILSEIQVSNNPILTSPPISSQFLNNPHKQSFPPNQPTAKSIKSTSNSHSKQPKYAKNEGKEAKSDKNTKYRSLIQKQEKNISSQISEEEQRINKIKKDDIINLNMSNILNNEKINELHDLNRSFKSTGSTEDVFQNINSKIQSATNPVTPVELLEDYDFSSYNFSRFNHPNPLNNNYIKIQNACDIVSKDFTRGIQSAKNNTILSPGSLLNQVPKLQIRYPWTTTSSPCQTTNLNSKSFTSGVNKAAPHQKIPVQKESLLNSKTVMDKPKHPYLKRSSSPKIKLKKKGDETAKTNVKSTEFKKGNINKEKEELKENNLETQSQQSHKNQFLKKQEERMKKRVEKNDEYFESHSLPPEPLEHSPVMCESTLLYKLSDSPPAPTPFMTHTKFPNTNNNINAQPSSHLSSQNDLHIQETKDTEKESENESEKGKDNKFFNRKGSAASIRTLASLSSTESRERERELENKFNIKISVSNRQFVPVRNPQQKGYDLNGRKTLISQPISHSQKKKLPVSQKSPPPETYQYSHSGVSKSNHCSRPSKENVNKMALLKSINSLERKIEEETTTLSQNIATSESEEGMQAPSSHFETLPAPIISHKQNSKKEGTTKTIQNTSQTRRHEKINSLTSVSTTSSSQYNNKNTESKTKTTITPNTSSNKPHSETTTKTPSTIQNDKQSRNKGIAKHSTTPPHKKRNMHSQEKQRRKSIEKINTLLQTAPIPEPHPNPNNHQIQETPKNSGKNKYRMKDAETKCPEIGEESYSMVAFIQKALNKSPLQSHSQHTSHTSHTSHTPQTDAESHTAQHELSANPPTPPQLSLNSHRTTPAAQSQQSQQAQQAQQHPDTSNIKLNRNKATDEIILITQQSNPHSSKQDTLKQKASLNIEDPVSSQKVLSLSSKAKRPVGEPRSLPNKGSCSNATVKNAKLKKEGLMENRKLKLENNMLLGLNTNYGCAVAAQLQRGAKSSRDSIRRNLKPGLNYGRQDKNAGLHNRNASNQSVGNQNSAVSASNRSKCVIQTELDSEDYHSIFQQRQIKTPQFGTPNLQFE